jgi:hypothetical protein
LTAVAILYFYSNYFKNSIAVGFFAFSKAGTLKLHFRQNVTIFGVAIKGSIGDIATRQPRCYIPLFSHAGYRVAKYNIYYLFFSWLLFI